MLKWVARYTLAVVHIPGRPDQKSVRGKHVVCLCEGEGKWEESAELQKKEINM